MVGELGQVQDERAFVKVEVSHRVERVVVWGDEYLVCCVRELALVPSWLIGASERLLGTVTLVWVARWRWNSSSGIP
jgi:hypothetical protein